MPTVSPLLPACRCGQQPVLPDSLSSAFIASLFSPSSENREPLSQSLLKSRENPSFPSAMADFSSRTFAFVLMAVVFAFSGIGGSFAADPPAPAPASGAVGIVPPFAVAFLVSFAAFLLGSLFR